MRWSEHPTTARHELKCQELCAALRSSGYGAYWMIIEAIGEYSNSLHLKVYGISGEVDSSYRELLMKSGGGMLYSGSRDVTHMVPELSHRVLARQCFMSEEELLGVIATCVDVGLFDEQKWMTYNILYSHELEARTGYYTKRLSRSQGIPPIQRISTELSTPCTQREKGEAPKESPAWESPASPSQPSAVQEAGRKTTNEACKPFAERNAGSGARSGILSDEGIHRFHRKLVDLVASLNEKNGSSFKLRITRDQLRELRSGFPETSIRNPGKGGPGSWICPQEAHIVVAVASLVSDSRPDDDQFQWLQAFMYNSFRTGLFNGGIESG